jgi:hypothetical protein
MTHASNHDDCLASAAPARHFPVRESNNGFSPQKSRESRSHELKDSDRFQIGTRRSQARCEDNPFG